MVKKQFLAFSIVVSLLLALTACGNNEADKDLLKVGHGGGYLSAAIYAAEYEADIGQFRSSSDVAYALLSGALDAGFVDADKLTALMSLDGFDRLTVAGKITYPYGATLVLRKGLNVRLQELDDLKIAASAPNCVLLEEFAADAERLGAELSDVNYIYMTFDTMLPALEAGTVDAAIIKGTYSVVALHEGHSILYQSWDVEPGDECCPAIIDQAALVLLVRREKSNFAEPFIDALITAQALSPDELRHAVAENTSLAFEALKDQPVPEFSRADDELADILFEAANEDHHDEENDNE